MEPGQSVPYAWDEPNHTRKLRCELDGAHGTALREPATHTYALDEIKVAPWGPALHLDLTTFVMKLDCGRFLSTFGQQSVDMRFASINLRHL